MNTNVDISILVISYNTQEMTLACLRSVHEQIRDLSFEIIVIDNNSSDDSVRIITSEFPDLNLIVCKENLGFARANNLAAEVAKGNYLLLLNPDTLVLNKAINKLHVFACNHPDNRVYGGRTLYGDFSLNPSSCWKKPSLWGLFCYATGLVSIFRRNVMFDPESYGSWQRDSVREVDIVSGCFLLIEKKLWDFLGGFDPLFFMYGEDADLCLRAIEAGARPIITPEATIVHYGGASEKVRADKMIRLLRAKGQLIRRHWRPGVFRIGQLLLRCSVFTRMICCSLLNRTNPRLFSARAESWNEIWQRRQEWQHH